MGRAANGRSGQEATPDAVWAFRHDLRRFLRRTSAAPTTTEDIVVDVYPVMWRGLVDDEPPDPAVLRSWLFGTAVRMLANHHRYEQPTRPSDLALSDAAWSRLAGLDDADRLAVLTRILVTSVAHALGTDRDALHLDRPLNTLGLDSLMLVGIQTEMNVMLATDLSLTGPLGTDSIREVAIDLDRRVRDKLATTSNCGTRVPPLPTDPR
jgi:DNA-directed RNA polymerase specialized sigma24 family protein